MSILSSNNYGNSYSGQSLKSVYTSSASATISAKSIVESEGTAETKSVSDNFKLSPQTHIKSVISEFKQSKASSLTISLTVNSKAPFSSPETQNKISKGVDKLLHMVSRNDEEYQQLKSSYEEMFGKASSEFNDTPTEEEVANIPVKSNVSAIIKQSSGEMKIAKGAFAGATIKYSSYKITMSFTNSENEEASESRSIANSFADAIANFFGYTPKSTKKSSSKASNEKYTPTTKEEAETMKKAYVLDSFSSNSVTVTAKSLKASLKASSASSDTAKSTISSSTTSVNASKSSVSASVKSTNSAVNTASSSYQRLQELKLQGCDPIVLDLSGEGINLTEAGKGANFDINADGKMDSTAWVAGNTAMLVYDKNGNNAIDDGSELFGDQNGASDGFKELAKYDDNNDGKINNQDAIYKNLKLYRDLNGDGKMSENEFSTLEDMGIKSLNLNAKDVDENVNGNSIVLSGSFEREDGTTGEMADAIFGYSTL